MLQRGILSAISADEFAQGTIIEIEERLPGEAYDPWQSITVLWDDDWSHLQLRSKVRGWSHPLPHSLPVTAQLEERTFPSTACC
jgi:hypothetical protein